MSGSGPGVPVDFSDCNYPEQGIGPPSPKWSHDDLAGRFTERHKDDLRYVAPWHKWMIYQSGCWRTDDKLKVFDRARIVCREASEEALIDERHALAKQLTTAGTVAAVEKMASWDQRTAATIDQWDASPWDLNTPHSTCELKSGQVREQRPEDYITKMTTITASSTGECSTWLRFLARVTDGDAELQEYLQRVAGYCLTGATHEHAMFFLYGVGANGKSTFCNTLLGIWGDYAQVAQIETFTETKSERHPTELAALRGARLVVASETELGNRWAESRIKMLTGGEPIRARFMRCDEFEFTAQFKLLIQGNHKPSLRSVDEAIRRRFHLVPFSVTIPPEERDPKLSDKLKQEWPGILRWAIDGCLEWQKRGLDPPQAVVDATEQYLSTEDALGCWMEERAIVSPQAGTTRTSVLYQDFKKWAEASGEHAMSQKKFSQALETKGFTIRSSNGKVADGIALREE